MPIEVTSAPSHGLFFTLGTTLARRNEMRMYEKFWYRAAALTLVWAAAISGTYAATEKTSPRDPAGERHPATEQADRISVPMASRTIELPLDVPARPASAAARTGNTELAATGPAVATANVAERASSTTASLAAEANASGGSPAADASPLRGGIWDASDVAGPASTRDQTPTADAHDTQLLPLRSGTDAAGPRIIDSTADDSWIRSASNFLREYRVTVMVVAAGLLGLTWLLSVLVRRNSSTALRRHSMAARQAHQALKPQRTRIRIRFRTGEPSHEHSHEHSHDHGQEHGQERGNNHVKREHRRRRRHSRPTAP